MPCGAIQFYGPMVKDGYYWSRNEERCKHVVKVAIAGYGHNGMIHAENVRKNPRAGLCAINSEEKNRASIGSLGITFYDDWQALLDTETIHGLDVVIIATPTFTHADSALDAIAKGAARVSRKTDGDYPREMRRDQRCR
jgi:glyceraldehyde-3-phosphate dehydrogenase/erythrose-4-phosphate dehydrogenase